MRKHPQIVIGVLLIALFICIAITAPLLAPNDPNATNLALKNAPPSAEYPLGCDQMGRCELSRLIYGARYSLSLTVPVLIVLAAILARMIAGLQRPTTGNIYVDGMPVYGKHKVHTNYFKEVQIIQQDSSSALDPKMSVGRSIEEPLLCFFHLDKGERKKRCHDLMDLCNLSLWPKVGDLKISIQL